jgi:hypothetical protein
VSVEFLPRLEIENYLLVSEAISKALSEELKLAGLPAEVDAVVLAERLQELIDDGEDKLYPQGKGADTPEERMKLVKGSLVLEGLYSTYELPYGKTTSGPLIARFITAGNQPALGELTAIVKPVFR